MQKVNPVDPDSKEAKEIRDEFDDNVNMTKKQIEDWLETDESKSVGQDAGGGESVGRQSAKRIIKILDKKVADLTGEDIGHMKKVNGYVSRHLEQRPEGNLEDADWTYSLRNWGHDPLK